VVRVLFDGFHMEEGRARVTAPLRITIEGHCGFDAKGSDVVCAGVSALAQTALLAVGRVAGLRQRLDQGDGYLSTEIELGGADDEQMLALKAILATLVVGLAEIEKINPGNVAMSFA
jgi:uncharacterized protein YsxB (DUF464 family)